ncbi:MAG: 6-bladed beta-propeller [Gemmatimonadota bacterium]
MAGRAGRGFYVAPVGPLVYEYDSSGKFLRSIGRRGSGPGEFGFIRRLFQDASDSLYVIDLARRMSLFDPDGKHVRSMRMPYVPLSLTKLADGSMVVAAPGLGRGDAGYPLHLIGTRGDVVRSFGSSNPVVDPAQPLLGNRFVAAGNNGSVWAARVDRYLVENWDPSGRQLASVERQVAWFSEQSADLRSSRVPVTSPERLTKPPPSAIRGLQYDSTGHLYVLLAVAGSDWRSHDIRVGEGIRLGADVLDKMFDSVLEEIDPGTGAVLGSLRVPQHFDRIIGRNTLASMRELPDGDRVVDVWEFGRFALRRR